MSGKATNLKARVMRAGVWTTIFSLSTMILRLGSSMILTRLLVPEVFGLVTLASVLLTIINLFSDIGLGPCVIYHKNGEDHDFLNTVQTMTAIRGVVITLIGALVALALKGAVAIGLFADHSAYSHPDLPAVLAMMALTSLILGFRSPKMFVCERRLDLKTLGAVEVVSQIVALIVTVILTWMWRSVWAIVVGGYTAAITTALLSHFWVKGPRGRFGWDKGYAGEIIRYGRWVLLSSVAHVLGMNADRILLGIWLAPTTLGFYSLALSIQGAATSIATRPFDAVALSAFSELARDRRQALREAYFRFRLPYDLISISGAGLLFATGQMIVDLLYDERYRLAGRTLQILSFMLLFPRFSVVATAHLALGHPQTSSWASVIRLATIVICVPIGHALWGYEGALWAIAFFHAPSVLFLFWKNRRFGLNDFTYELKMLFVWPVGFAAGWLVVRLAQPLLAAVGRL